jgi:gluconolactonase
VRLLLVVLGLTATALQDLPPADQVKTVKVAEVPAFCEGAVVDPAGNLYFSVCARGEIMRLTPAGDLSVWAKTPQPNGHKVLPDGTHLVCDAVAKAVLRLDAAAKALAPAAKECEGQPLRGPNDLTLDLANGGFYFTDPGGCTKDKPIGTVHYVDRDGQCTTVARSLGFPNGIVLRPGGKALLVAESHRNRILEFEVAGPGRLGVMKVFAELPTKAEEQIDNQPDGICLDEVGNLYVAHFGMRQVQVLDPTGKLLRRYPAGNLTTSNVCFAGERFDQLYVTGGLERGGDSAGGLFRIDLPGVRGLRPFPSP